MQKALRVQSQGLGCEACARQADSFARGLLLAFLTLFAHGFERLAFHHAHVGIELVVLARIEVHSVEPVQQDVVVEAGGAARADAPLSGEAAKEVEGRFVLGPDINGLLLEVLRPEPPRGQFVVGWRGFVERSGGGLQFPRRPSTTAAR